MKFLSARKILGIAFAFAALALALPAYAQTGGATGKVILQDGSPCQKCIILIERQDIKGTYKTKTNKKGEYIYIGLAIGDYKVVLESPSGKQLFYIMKHISLGDPTVIDFDMPKEMANAQQERKAEEKANPELAKKAEEQEKEQKEFKGLKQFFDQGNIYYNQKQYKQAAEMFEKALPLAKEKNLPIVLSRLADTYAKAKENDQAIATYEKALAANPADPASLHNNMGSVYATMGKYPEAQAEFEKAAQLNPTKAGTYYFNIGVIMYNAGKMDEALAAFKKVISVDPSNAEAYFLEGQALMGKATYTKTGKVKAPDGTIEAYQQYLKLDPNGPNAPTAKAMIATLQGKVSTQYKK